MNNNLLNLHFLILSVIPLLLIYSNNVHEIPPLDIVFPVILSLVFSGIIFGILRIKWNTQRSAIISSILFINFIVFGNIRYFLKNDIQLNFEYLTVTLLIIFLITIVLSIFFILRKNVSNEISRIFTIFSLSLILILTPNILFFYIDSEKENTELFEINLDVEMTSKPDVYVIIMDEFAGEIQLSRDFDYYPEKFF